MAGKAFDIVVLGATGFTGGLVARYLAQNAKPTLRWALAGRNPGRLAAVKNALAGDSDEAIAREAERVGVIVCDTSDITSLDAMTRQTRVVICVRNRTDYVDTTGESPWVLDMIRAHDGTARANGVCIVPTCGFDSIPSDLGCFMVVDYMRTKLRQGVADVKAGFSVGGSASGGTLHTMMGLIDSGRARDMANPRHLCVPPTDVDDAPDPRAIVGPVRNTVLAWDADFKKWQIPFLMAGVNNAVVRRSAYLAAVAGTPYTRPTTDAAAASDEVDSVPFTYNETMSRSGFLRAFFIAGMMGVGVLLAMVSVCRRLAARFVLPAPGTGPSPAVRSRSFFRTKFVATSVGAAPVKVIGEVSGGDPGYDETAKMVAEAGLCLAENRDELPGRGGGILTPASAFGHTLIRRLTKANMQFTVHEAGAPSKL